MKLSINIIFLLAALTLCNIQSQGQENISLFESIYNLTDKPKVTFTTNFKKLLGKSRKEEYQPATFQLHDSGGNEIYNMDGQIRARGNMRKQVCAVPPVKLDLESMDLINLGLDTIDKIKFVFPCKGSKADQERLFKEFLAYEIYSLIDTNYMRAKLIDVEFIYEGKTRAEYTGFIVEDEKEYARRKNAKIVEVGRIIAQVLHRPSFLKMIFFQYMIGNTDWSVSEKHNLEMVSIKGIDRVVAIPYDFDYAGLVDQPYAIPHESIPIKNVKERYFHPYKVTESEFNTMVDYYKSIKEDVLAKAKNATYMSEKSRDKSWRYLNEFFKLIESPNWLKGRIVR